MHTPLYKALWTHFATKSTLKALGLTPPMGTTIPDDYPVRTRHLRARLGLTQQQLAVYLGFAYATVNR